MNGTELRSFSHFQILTKIAYPDLRTKLDDWLILEFFFIYCKTVQFNQDDKYPMETRFTSVFLMNGTELKSLSYFQIFTKITYPDLRTKLDNWLILELFFIPVKLCNSTKMINIQWRHDLQVFSWWMEQN